MTLPEDRLRELLHRLTPEPPSQITDLNVPGDYAPRGPRKRRWLPALAAAAVVAAVGAGVAILASTDRTTTPSPATQVGATPPDLATLSSSSNVTGRGQPCSVDHLNMSVGRRGSVASAPYIVVWVRNQGTSTCTLTGYPAISIFGTSSRDQLSIAIHHGTYEVQDRGPHSITLPRGGIAWFAVGTSLGYQGGKNIVTITRISIGVPGGVSNQVVDLNLEPNDGLPATGNPGAPLPIGITAFSAGTGS